MAFSDESGKTGPGFPFGSSSSTSIFGGKTANSVVFGAVTTSETTLNTEKIPFQSYNSSSIFNPTSSTTSTTGTTPLFAGLQPTTFSFAKSSAATTVSNPIFTFQNSPNQESVKESSTATLNTAGHQGSLGNFSSASSLFGKKVEENDSGVFQNEPTLFGKKSGEVMVQNTFEGFSSKSSVFGKSSIQNQLFRGDTSAASKSNMEIGSESNKQTERTLFGKAAATSGESEWNKQPSETIFGQRSAGVSSGMDDAPVKTLFGKEDDSGSSTKKAGLVRSQGSQNLFQQNVNLSHEKGGFSRSSEAKDKQGSRARVLRRRSTAEDISSYTAIVCRGVPDEWNEKELLKKHFSHYGNVTKIYPNPGKQQAIIHFDSHNAALKAKKNGARFAKDSTPMTILWRAYKAPQKSPGKQSGLETELESLKGTSDLYDGVYNTLERPSKTSKEHARRPAEERSRRPAEEHSRRPAESRKDRSEISQRSRSSSPMPLDVKIKQYTGSKMDNVKTPVGAPKMMIVPMTSLHSMTAKSSSDVCDILEQRDKLVRSVFNTTRQGSLVKAEALKGTCPDMCPEKERYLRMDRRRLHKYEMIPGSYSHSELPQIDHAKAVKEYSRSSADQDVPLPHELRPGPVLEATMNYLMNNILDIGKDGEWDDWFDFVWNRTRGIRKDITQQQLCDHTSVSLVEKCVRFHIYCSQRLCEEDMAVFDPKINNENLTKCLQTLKEMYADLAKQGIFCPNEAEFRAYVVLMNLNEGDTLREVQQFKDEIRLSREMKFAISVFAALESNNYVKFFKLVNRATFLQACILHRYFNQVRMNALLRINRAYTVGSKPLQFSMENLMRQLGFEDPADAEVTCSYFGILVNDQQYVTLERGTFYRPEKPLEPRRARRLIEAKQVTCVGEVINGAPLPPNDILDPENSFDDQGCYMVKNIPLEIQVPATFTGDTQPAPSAPEKPVIKAANDGKVAIRPDEIPYPIEAVKDEARSIFNDVIFSMCTDIADIFMKLQFAFLTLAPELYNATMEPVLKDLIHSLAKDVVDEELMRSAQKEREELQEQISNDLCDVILENHLQQAVASIADFEFKEEKRLHRESEERVMISLISELIVETCTDEVRNLANGFHEREVVDRLHQLRDCEEAVHLLKIESAFKKWRKEFQWRKCLKTSIQSFPAAPSMQRPEEQIKRLLPESGGISGESFHLNSRARMSILTPVELNMRSQLADDNLAARMFLRHRLLERIQAPLDVGRVISHVLSRKRKSQAFIRWKDNNHFWKLVVSLPPYTEKLSTWLQSKLQHGTVPSCEPKIWSMHSTVLRRGLGDAFSGEVHTSVRALSGILSPSSARQCSTKRHLQGAGALLFVLSNDALQLNGDFDLEQTRLRQMLMLKPSKPSLPLVIMYHLPKDISEKKDIKQDIIDSLMVEDLVQCDLISSYKLCCINDLERMDCVDQLVVALRWLVENQAELPNLETKPLLDYVEDALIEFFSTPLFENLALRKKKNLPQQEPQDIIDFYNSVITHFINTATDSSLEGISWPISEFAAEYRELPKMNWNQEDNFEHIEKNLLNLYLPDLILTGDHDDYSWMDVYDDVMGYVTAIASQSEITDIQLISKVQRLLQKAGKDFQMMNWFLEKPEPDTLNIPWAEIVMACVQHQLNYFHKQDEDFPDLTITYQKNLLQNYKPPECWSESTSKLNAKEQSSVSLLDRRTKRKQIFEDDFLSKRVKPMSTWDYRPESEKVISADDSARRLGDSLAIEKQAIEDYDRMLTEALDSGAGDITYNQWQPELASGQPTYGRISESSSIYYTPQTSLQTSRLVKTAKPTPLSRVMDESIYEEAALSMEDNIKYLNETIQSQRDANDVFEMRLKMAMLGEPMV